VYSGSLKLAQNNFSRFIGEIIEAGREISGPPYGRGRGGREREREREKCTSRTEWCNHRFV
jgi:hypothetical protein